MIDNRSKPSLIHLLSLKPWKVGYKFNTERWLKQFKGKNGVVLMVCFVAVLYGRNFSLIIDTNLTTFCSCGLLLLFHLLIYITRDVIISNHKKLFLLRNLASLTMNQAT